MLVKYLRDKNRNPFGVVVAIGFGKVGYSICHPTKDQFDKSKALMIATERAYTPRVGQAIRMPPDTRGVDVYYEFDQMLNRSYKYYKSV